MDGIELDPKYLLCMRESVWMYVCLKRERERKGERELYNRKRKSGKERVCLHREKDHISIVCVDSGFVERYEPGTIFFDPAINTERLQRHRD